MFVELLVKPDWYNADMSLRKDMDVIEVTDLDGKLVYTADFDKGVEPRKIDKRGIRFYIPESLAEVHELLKKSEQRSEEEKNLDAVRLLTDS